MNYNTNCSYRHYINSSFKLKSYAIAIAYLNEPYSGKYIFKVLSKALEE